MSFRITEQDLARHNALADEIVEARKQEWTPRGADPLIDKYETELPEADQIMRLLDGNMRERGWQRLQRDDRTYGSALPWPKTSDRFRLRPAEMTIWAGPNGVGKSSNVNFVLGHLAWHNETVFIGSLELSVEDQIARLARQMLCNPHPVRARFDRLIDKLGKHYYVYDHIGRVRPERALAIARYAAIECKARHVLIDNLTMVVPPGARDSDQVAANFVAGLYRVAHDTKCHIHLIAHVRKPSDPNERLTRYDIRGTGAASDMVDNCVLIQLNEKKQREKEEDRASQEDPDVWVIVDKQRHAGWRGKFGFWFYETSLRLAESGLDIPLPYLPQGA